MADPVIKKIQNMTKYIPLDWTVNGAAKAFLKSKFTEWYNSCIAAQLYECKAIENVKVKAFSIEIGSNEMDHGSFQLPDIWER